MKKSILILILFACCLGLNAQWSIRTYRLKRDLLCDFTSSLSPTNYAPGYAFFGPMFSLDENVITRGATPFHVPGSSPEDTMGRAADLVWSFSSPYQQTISPKETFLYINCYSENIAGYAVLFQDPLGRWYKKEFQVKNDQYQLPAETALDQWTPLDQPAHGNSPEARYDTLRICRFYVTVRKREPSAPAKLVIGECKLLHHAIIGSPGKACFFYQVTGDTANREPSYTYTSFGNSYPIPAFTIFRDIYAQKFSFSYAGYKDSSELRQRTLGLLAMIADKYPYYTEHQINKLQVQARIQQVLASDAPFNERLRIMDSLFTTFSDGHFYFEKPGAPKTSGPVYVKEINGEILVAGIFNDKLKQDLPLGARITAIDGMPVNTFIARSSGRYFGENEVRRSMAISRMLFKPKTDSTSLDFVYNGKPGQITYYYSDQVTIPANFKPVHDEFRVLDGCAYLKLNRWDPGDWVRFYNNRAALQQCSKIIFDLRGNTGGVEVEADRILSCFIDHPVSATLCTYRYNDDSTLQAINTINPNPYLDLRRLSVIILVDNKTACGSEIFTSVLRNHAHATVIGSERTSGAYASGEIFYLPFNLILHTDILSKLTPPKGEKAIEYTGISPDITVPLDSFSDLYPYKDKVLATAIRFATKGSMGGATMANGSP